MTIVHPSRGRKKTILNLVKENAKTLFANQAMQSNAEERINILKDLTKMFRLKTERLSTIEFLDLSYFDNKLTVAGFSHYLNGAPLLKKNKIYQINPQQHNEKEYFKSAIFTHYQKNALPELIILDGGILQLQGAKEGLKLLEKNTNLITLVKNKKHQTEYILDSQGQRMQIDLNSKT